MNHIPLAFRVFWILLTFSAWLLLVYLLQHKSQHPSIVDRYSWAYFGILTTVFGLAVVLTILNSRLLLQKAYVARYSIFLSFASFIFSFVLIEIFLRVADPLGISYYERLKQSSLHKIPDRDLIYRLKPNYRSYSKDHETWINEDGLRDDPILPKRNSEFRILALGDSVTYGSGVSQYKIYTVRLQQILTAKLGRPMRVINAGVGGYNTVQQLTFLQKTGLSLSPDLILLMYVSNDIEVQRPYDPEPAGSLDQLSTSQIMDLILAESWLYRLARHAQKVGWFAERVPLESKRESTGWKSSIQALKEITRICQKHEIPLAVFFYRNDIDPNPLLEDIRTAVEPFSVQDVGKWFADKPVRQYMISKIDSHPNSEGHRVVAENVAAYLIDRGLLNNKRSYASFTANQDN